ncbi:L,D-transpeptidase family protein [Patulibacter minatonensis]|uniref:L,D-transpeptidase family protein n=1 Tax=Patulibacter minatonensis TaxID=298163 RepID=UPI0004AD3B0D|nr:L,D-transpeptidase family protein [Patulibacter minatonensis]
MSRSRTIALGSVVAAALLVLAVLWWQADRASGRIADGVSVAGVDVGGLTRSEALAKVQEQAARPLNRSARLTIGGETHVLTAKRAGVRADFAGAVDRATEAGSGGSFLSRGWRELTGGEVVEALDVPVRVDETAVKRFVATVADDVRKAPVEASIDIAVTRVSVKDGKNGSRLRDRSGLQRQLVTVLRDGSSERTVRARTISVKPKKTAKQVMAAQPTVVTVAHDERRVRVFDEGKQVATYRVAVGSAQYPTPYGRFQVQTMQKNPVWNVPNSSWAGSLAGQTIPGGDPRNPLKERWIGFSGSVGFHGTSEAGSLGSAASHGCVRMDPTDVKALFEQVEVGTPVLVG